MVSDLRNWSLGYWNLFKDFSSQTSCSIYYLGSRGSYFAKLPYCCRYGTTSVLLRQSLEVLPLTHSHSLTIPHYSGKYLGYGDVPNVFLTQAPGIPYCISLVSPTTIQPIHSNRIPVACLIVINGQYCAELERLIGRQQRVKRGFNARIGHLTSFLSKISKGDRVD